MLKTTAELGKKWAKTFDYKRSPTVEPLNE